MTEAGNNFQFSSLGGELFSLEEERKKVLRLKQISFAGSAIVFIIAVLVVFNTRGLMNSYAGIILMTLMMLIFWGVIKPVLKKQSNFKLKYRQLVVEKLIKKIDPNIIYDPAGFVSEGHFMASDIYDAYTEDYKGENYFNLELPSYSIEFSQITALDAGGSNNKNQKVIFKGLMYLVKWDKQLTGRTIIATDKSLGVFGSITNYFESKKFDGYKRWKVDHKEFEDLFQVYSNNHQETASLLDQNFIDTLIALRRKHPEGIQISLGAKNMYILVNTDKRFFNPRTDVKVDSEEQIQTYYTDLQEILEIVHRVQPIIQSIR